MGKPYKLGGDLTSTTKDKLVQYCNNDKRQQLLKVCSKTFSAFLVKIYCSIKMFFVYHVI